MVCSSGGVKCFSYIGAVQKLVENNITIASVSACSMGTVLGALICSGLDIKKIEEAALNFDFATLKTKKTFWFFNYLRYPFATHHTPDYVKLITSLIGEDITLGQMKIPFSVAALDLRQKRFLVYSSETHPGMKVSEITQIATAIPFLYQPYKMEKRLLVDAAVGTESPVWMAASNPGYFPIVVLKPANTPTEDYRKNFPYFLSHLISASTGSHDYFAMSQTSRSVEISINCENMDYANFNLTRLQIENMILQGQAATEQKRREFNNNFSHVLDIEDIKGSGSESNSANKAELLANQMITGYQNEIIRRNQVFVSYSRKDKDWLLRLRTSLKSAERFAGIKAWNDTSIAAGEEWNNEIEKALVSAKVAVFLVTPNFLASEFIQEKEMKYFLEMSSRERVPILWIAVSSSLYELTPLNDIQCANDPQRPLDKLSEPEQNEAFTEICKKIIKAMKGQPE